MDAKDQNLFNNDIVFRLGALALAAALKGCVDLYFDFNQNPIHGFFIAPILNNALFLWLSSFCIKTAFTQDVKELALIELLASTLFYIFFLSPKTPTTNAIYTFFDNYIRLFLKVTYVIFVVRIYWPCKNNASGECVNWPVFGFIGLYFKIRKIEYRVEPPTSRQAILAYATISIACVIGYILWRNGVKNAYITQAIPAILIFGFACIKSRGWLMKRIGEYHKKRAEAHRLQELARIAEAKAACLAGECQGLQAAVTAAQKIISHQMDVFAQTQDEQAKERAHIAALEAVIASGYGAVADAGLLREILNPDNPHYSIRMAACVKMFEHFQAKRITGKSPKDAIAKYAMEHAEELGLMYKGEPSQNAADQCAFVLNWVNEGGSPRTQARTE